MLYNKNTVSKVNDKKLLHKVGKQWKVVSVALLLALGGEAVASHNATHANADTNSQQTSMVSNNSTSATQNSVSASSTPYNSSTQATINSLEAMPNLDSEAQSTSASSTAQSQSTTKSKATKSISYVDGDNGSAASYHNEANSEERVYNSNSDLVSGYVNKVRKQFPTEYQQLSEAYNKDNHQYKHDNSLANSYKDTTNQSDYSSLVSSEATAHGMDAPEYVYSVEAMHNHYSADIQSGSNVASQMSVVNSYAQLISEIDTNSAVSAEYNSIAKQKDASAGSLQAELLSARAVNNSLQAKVSEGSTASYKNISDNAMNALQNSSADSQFVSSLAQSLGYDNNLDVNDDIQSYADNHVTAPVEINNHANSLVTLDSNAQSALSQAISDASAMNQYVSATPFDVGSINQQASSASNTVQSLQSKYDEQVIDNSNADILGDYPTLANIFGYNSYGSNASMNVSEVESALAAHVYEADPAASASVSSVMSATSSAVASVSNAIQTSDKANHQTNSGLNWTDFTNDLYTNQSAISGSDSSIASTADNDLLNVFDTHNLVPVDQFAQASSDVSAYVNSSAGSLSINASNINSVANSVEGSLADEQSTASSYADATDEDLTLADYFADSYASDANDDKAKVNGDNNALDNFYSQSNPNYNNAKNAMTTAESAEVDDNGMAQANGIHVYNYAPKLITVTKDLMLHTSPTFSERNHTAGISKGTHLKVVGIGLTKNGMLRYLVDYKGDEGYVTARSDYIKPQYLFAKNKDTVAIQINRTMWEHGKLKFHGTRKKMLHKGDVVYGQIVAEPDSNFGNKRVYGGYTRIKLDNGRWITANTDFVSLSNSKKLNKKAKHHKKNNSYHTGVVNFSNSHIG